MACIMALWDHDKRIVIPMTGTNGVRIQAALDYREDNVLLKGFQLRLLRRYGFRNCVIEVDVASATRITVLIECLAIFHSLFSFSFVLSSTNYSTSAEFSFVWTRHDVVEDY
jgi:hypothetical protein